jgi:plastocyanin
MRIKFIIAAAVGLASVVAHAGNITGTVRAQPKEGTEADGEGGKYDSRKLKFVERVNYTTLKDFVIYIEGPASEKPKPPEKPETVVTSRNKVTQEGAQFSPHVLPIVVGTTVEWPNNDRIYHNVFSFSEPKNFDLGLYKSGDSKQVTFDKPGRVDVFCSIHSTMSCIVLVMENQYFAKADEKGNYVIANVPPGTYKLKVWHERLPPQVKEVIVPAEGDVKADFTMGITGLPKL